MRLWIDTEFNEFRGALISLALVDEDGREFYQVVPCERPGSWVAANVMPILGQPPVSMGYLQMVLQDWLAVYDSLHVVADWPEDIEHFCRALIVGPGLRINTPPLTMEVRRDLDGVSQLPHNALADAKANRLAHLALEGRPADHSPAPRAPIEAALTDDQVAAEDSLFGVLPEDAKK